MKGAASCTAPITNAVTSSGTSRPRMTPTSRYRASSAAPPRMITVCIIITSTPTRRRSGVDSGSNPGSTQVSQSRLRPRRFDVAAVGCRDAGSGATLLSEASAAAVVTTSPSGAADTTVHLASTSSAHIAVAVAVSAGARKWIRRVAVDGATAGPRGAAGAAAMLAAPRINMATGRLLTAA